MRKIALTVFGLIALILSTGSAFATGMPSPSASQITITSLTPSLSSPQMLGTAITWTAQATGAPSIEYRFEVARLRGPASVVQDYSPSNTYTWTAIHEGIYRVAVLAQPAGGGTPAVMVTYYGLTPRATTTPVITPTSNPLVFLYSGPACSTGNVAVRFGQVGGNYATTTALQPCDGLTVNTYLAGIRASSQYAAAQVNDVSGKLTVGPSVSFTSGAISDQLTSISVIVPPTASTSLENNLSFFDLAQPKVGTYAIATDLSGSVVWYYPLEDYANLDPGGSFVVHPVQGGTVLLMFGAHQGVSSGFGGISTAQVLREVDLAGNVVHQTTVGRINEQLSARGDQTIDSLHHEAVRLPNGHTAVLGYIEELSTSAQGGTPQNPVDIIGDEIIDLDQNFQVDWVWNSFVQQAAWINRSATLGETCTLNSPGCVQLGPTLATTANDWLHSNAIAISNDGNLLLSERHQDWIVKIAYNNATGDGHIIWRLGLGGDFTLSNPGIDPYPWFSHQHGIENNKLGSGDTLLTFDDGNVRCNGATPGTCDSRGQVWSLNETAMTATLSDNQDMGNYSFFLGWAQTLANGDYWWTSGGQVAGQGVIKGDGQEFSPFGQATYTIGAPTAIYRVYRMLSMYSY